MALMHVCFKSQVLELDMRMSVLLPERECTRKGGKWPVLYLLHGLSDDHTAWERRTSIERYAQALDLAVVMPEVHRSFYTDMKHGGKYWTFISEELPALCERMFPISAAREDRFAAGLSMGGYGAFKLGLVRPERFAAVASLSGAVDILFGVSPDQPSDTDRFSFFQDIFGEYGQMLDSDDDLPASARRLIKSGKPLPKFYQVCGTEDFLYEANVHFRDEFAGPLAITYVEAPGSHTWAFWDEYIQKVLAWLPIQ